MVLGMQVTDVSMCWYFNINQAYSILCKNGFEALMRDRNGQETGLLPKRCDTLSLPFFANVKVFGIICVLASRSFHVYERFPYCLLWRLRDPKLVVLGPNVNDVLESCRQSGYCFYTYYFWGNNLQPSPLVIWRLLDRFSFKHSIYELLECLFLHLTSLSILISG